MEKGVCRKLLKEELEYWEIDDESYRIINIDLIETLSDISPVIMYISKVELGEKTTTEEAKILLKYLLENYPMLSKEFEAVLFQAYEEFPLLQTKRYNYYRVPLKLSL